MSGAPTGLAANAMWPRHPVLYEINAWVWLEELSRRAGRALDLRGVPASEWDALARLGVDGVWLMGVWERSPEGRRIALEDAALSAELRSALPGVTERDVVGSPYCVRRYAADPRLGGRDGLAAARRELTHRGLRLVLDFVPNHVAPDHTWVREHPEYFVQGDALDLRRDADSFREVAGRVFACGRDPHFQAWRDVLQLDAFSAPLREAAAETLGSIAELCDGVRCDMAMLVTNDVFARTWGARVGPPPAEDFWPAVLATVRRRHPELLLVAEVYWDLERSLLRQGFDYCYDKRLYDLLRAGDADGVRRHLSSDAAFQARLVRFIENHDEARAAAAFPGARSRAAAVAFATLPGARLLHEGQLEGRRARLPVQLARRPDEPPDPGLEAFYARLLRAVAGPAFRGGGWRPLECEGWPDNATFRELLAWSWELGGERHVVVVNLSDAPAQARVRLPWPDLAARRVRLSDAIRGEVYDRDGAELAASGLYVELGAWDVHLLALATSEDRDRGPAPGSG